MNPYARYQQTTPSWTRVDMLLALYDGAVQRCEQALEALDRGDDEAARGRLAKAGLIVAGLASGVVADGDPVTTNMLRLFEYAAHALKQGTADDVRGALNVLKILREGFHKIRDEAVALERAGSIPPITSDVSALGVTA